MSNTNWLELLKNYIGWQGATSLADKLTLARAGYLDNVANAQLLNVPNLSTLSAARIGYLDNINQAGLLQLTAARAALLDQITAARLAELDAANIPADIDTLLTRLPAVLSAARIGYLDNINNANLSTIPNISTLSAARIGYLDNINNAQLLNISAAILGRIDEAISAAKTLTAGTLTSIRQSVCLTGDPASSIGKILFDGDARLTAARAGYLDNLSGGAVALAASWTAGLATILGNFSANRIGYLDNINQAGLLQVTVARAGYLDNLLGVVSTAGSPFSLVNNTNEQDAIVVAAATQLVDIELDVNALTQSNTIREHVQVDGATYRQISAKVFPTDFDTGTKAISLSYPQKGVLYKVTMQAAVAEGAARSIPFRRLSRDLL